MTPATVVIWAALVPGTIALLAALLGSRSATPALARWLVAGGVTAGYVAGQLGMVGWQGFDGDITHGLLVLALVGALLGGLEGHTERASLRWALRGATSLAAAWLLLRPLLPPQLMGLGLPSNAVSALWWPGLSLVFLSVWGALDQLACRDQGRLLPVLLVLLASSGGATVLFAGNASTAALSGPLAATLGAIFVVGVFRPRAAFLRPAVPVIALLLVGQWSIGRFYTDNLSLASAGLLVGGPMLLALASPLVQRVRPVLAVLLQLLVLGLPAGAAAGMAAVGYFSPTSAAISAPARHPSKASPATSRPQSDDDYGY